MIITLLIVTVCIGGLAICSIVGNAKVVKKRQEILKQWEETENNKIREGKDERL